MAGGSVFFIFNLITILGGSSVSAVLAAATRSLWLDCPCIYATEVNKDNRGVFSVNSKSPRFSRSDCVLIFVMGSASNTVQLDLKEVHLQPNCVEYVELFPYLKEPVIENTTLAEYTMCHSHFKRNISLNYAPEELNEIASQLDAAEEEQMTASVQLDVDVGVGVHVTGVGVGGQEHQQSLFSGGRIYGLRVIFKPFSVRNDSGALYIRGEYTFLDKAHFENDGRLIPGTYCDYYFFAEELSSSTSSASNDTNDVWKYFHSPRYPANYPAHIQCSYKFIGRPEMRVEVMFDELLMPKFYKSCNLDKVTIYDAESPNVSSSIDVICETVHNKRVYSNGPDLLIEFNASSNQTAKGFRGKFKFVDAINFKKDKLVIASPNQNEILSRHSHSHGMTGTSTGSGSSSPLVNPPPPGSAELNYKNEGKQEKIQ